MSVTSRQDVDGDLYIKGNITVLGSQEIGDFASLITEIQQSRVTSQRVKAWADALLLSIIRDSLLSITEKADLKRRWQEIVIEYPIVRNRATGIGMLETDTKIVFFDGAYNALDTYLNISPGLLVDMTTASDIDAEEFLGKFNDYIGAREDLLSEALFLEHDAIERVRNGDIVEGAIARAALEAGFLSEYEATVSELFPAGVGSSSAIEIIEPRTAINESTLDYLLSLVGDSEEQLELRALEIKLIASQADEDRTRISSLEIGLDSITQTVAELVPLQEGQLVNLSQITQNAHAIEQLVTEGTYDPGTGSIDSYTLAQTKLLKDRFEVFIGGGGGDYDLASWIVKQDEISAIVQSVLVEEGTLVAAVTQIIQDDQSIRMQAVDLRSETIEQLDEAFAEAQAGILITSQHIELAVQEQAYKNEQLSALIVVEAEKITSEVQRAIGAEEILASQIIQTAESINLAVWGPEGPGGQSLSSQLAMLAGSFAAQVEGGGSSAFLSLSVTIPATITPAMRAAMVTASSEAEVAAVYAPTAQGFYIVRSDAITSSIKTLKDKLRIANLLGSQIVLDADEILMGSRIRASHLDIDDVNASGMITVGTDQIDGLLNVHGKIIVDLIDTEDLFATNAVFRGSILSGPLELNVSPAVNVEVGIPSSIKLIDLVQNIVSAIGQSSGSFVCLGTLNGVEFTEIEYAFSTQAKRAEFWMYKGELYNSDWMDKYWSDYTRRDCSIKLSHNGVVIYNASDYHETPKYWSGPSGFLFPKGTHAYDSMNPPNSIPELGGTVYPGSGTVSFTQGTSTMKLVNLTTYLSTLPSHSVYLEADAAGDYYVKVKS